MDREARYSSIYPFETTFTTMRVASMGAKGADPLDGRVESAKDLTDVSGNLRRHILTAGCEA
jgi:hypothetical protein